MDDEIRAEDLYARGMEHFRAARWEDAARDFAALRAQGDASPEVEALLADARLKIEIDRVAAPEGALPPRPPRRPPMLLIGGLALTLVAALLLIALRPAPSAAPAPTPTPAPTSQPAPTATPKPTATPRPTATPAPTATPRATATAGPTNTPAPARPGTLLVRAAGDQPLVRITGNIEIILDASGSMLARIGARRKIDIAREALGALVAKMPDTANVALRAYGHRHGKDCADTEAVVPLARLDRAALTDRINAINPSQDGMTLIGRSLQQVAGDLKGAKGDTLVVLVSDGEETCDNDPVPIAAQLHAANPRLRIDVIGFSIGPADSRGRLSAIAQSGGGSYFDAGSADQLTEALRQAVTLSYRVIGADGSEVYRGALGSPATLPAGRYRVEISGDAPLDLGGVVVASGATTQIDVREQDGALQGAVATPAPDQL